MNYSPPSYSRQSVGTDPADIPFKARITAAYLVTSGLYQDKWIYNFIQVARNSPTGTYLDAPGHTGNYEPPDEDGDGELLSVPALEVNNRRVETDAIVEMRQIITRGVVGYEFEYAGQDGDEQTAAASSSSWVAGLTSDDCVRATIVRAAGLCSTLDTTQDILLTWDSGLLWQSGVDDFTGTGSGGTGQVTFERTTPVPTATIDGEGGFYLGPDGAGGLLYAFGGAVLCDAGGEAAGCDPAFLVRFACSCCDVLAGYTREGWYCVRDAGSSDPCVARELLDRNKCDDTIEICSGPYADEATATAACAAPESITLTCVATEYTFLGVYALGITASTTPDQTAAGECLLVYDSDASPDADGWHYWRGGAEDFYNRHTPTEVLTCGTDEGAMAWEVRVRCDPDNPGFCAAQMRFGCGATPASSWIDIPQNLDAAGGYTSGYNNDPGLTVGLGGCSGCPIGVSITQPV